MPPVQPQKDQKKKKKERKRILEAILLWFNDNTKCLIYIIISFRMRDYIFNLHISQTEEHEGVPVVTQWVKNLTSTMRMRV